MDETTTKRRRRRGSRIGIRWQGKKQYAYVKVDGVQYGETFSALASDDEMQQWRRDEVKRRSGRDPDIVDGSFADLAATYLVRHAAQPTITQKMAHLELWVQALGRDLPLRAITTDAIVRVLNRWRLEPVPPSPETPGPRRGRPPVNTSGILGIETIRKRRTSLKSFFAEMAPTMTNPVNGAKLPPRPEDAAPRAIDYLRIERVLAAMPDYRDTKRGAPRERNLSKLRAGVIAYTGLPPGMVAKVKRIDLSLREGTLSVGPRFKGRGASGRVLRLNEDALVWWRAFDAADAYGSFAVSSLNVSFKRAATSIGLTDVHTYDLRHSYLTELYRLTADEATVARAGLHAEGSPMTARYTRGAHADVDAAASEAFSASLAARRRQARARLVKPVTVKPNTLRMRTKVLETAKSRQVS